MYPVLASATAPAISGALSTRPQRRRSLAGFKEVSYYHRVTPAGLITVHEDTPFVAGVASATVATLGVVHSGDEDRWFPETACAHTGAVHGPVDPVLHA